MHRIDVRVILEGTGSRGDIAPLLALGKRLSERGYRCHLLTNSVFRADAERAGIRFHGISERTANFARDERVDFEDYLFPGLATFRRWADGYEAEGVVVVNCGRFSASSLWCERHQIPTVRLALSPFVFRS